ncbi:MAG: signal peptide peptidase SppA [Candidatus Marinimicrobia bacterium]|nr:signal peptide peptidase SppA [Candidatus Neomarinimicrobiota bacterium]MCF7850482.1 signal peptide peptidase SppA [Candidatus Neomarinimicrobiota bacterium]
MDNKYKRKNRIYGVVFIAVLVLLLVIVSRSDTDEKWFDYQKRIAVLPLEGEIMSSRGWIEQLGKFADNKRIAGILIPINSPGGLVAPSQEIYEAIRLVRDETTKPIFVSMGSVAASGGYYAAVGADSIFANAGSLTGSIGVVMQFPIYSDLMEKVGIGMRVVKSQEFKDAGSPYREMTEDERSYFKDIIDDVYTQFVGVVSHERGIDEINMRSLGNGRVFTGRQAEEYGLVDAVGTFEEARKALCQVAGISINSTLQYPPEPRRSWWTRFAEDVGAAIPDWEARQSIKLQYRIPY